MYFRTFFIIFVINNSLKFMTEDRVYFNSENFKNSFNEKEVDDITKISVIKYEIKKLFRKSLKLKIENSQLIREKAKYTTDFQKAYEKMTNDLPSSEAKDKWNNSPTKLNLQLNFSLIKEKIRAVQLELKNTKKEIKSKNIDINNIRYGN